MTHSTFFHFTTKKRLRVEAARLRAERDTWQARAMAENDLYLRERKESARLQTELEQARA